MNKFKEIVEFFQNHPKFPFDFWYQNYDEYVAANLMILNIIKCYIPPHEIKDWEYTQAYFDIRREPETRTPILLCQNRNRQQVFLIGLVESRDNSKIPVSLALAVTRDDFYGGKWEENVPMEEWYSVFQARLNFNRKMKYREVDKLLKNYFDRKLSFDELRIIQESFEDPADE